MADAVTAAAWYTIFMLRWMTATKVLILAFGVLLVLFALGWATREDPRDKPYLHIAGGGFLFNYRIAEVSYGFTAMVARPIPTGTIIEASFEDPQGGRDLIVRRRVGTDTARYGFQSPPVRGVAAHHPYRVTVTVIDRERKNPEPIWRHSFTIASQISDDVMPERPLTVGPGYTRNLEP